MARVKDFWIYQERRKSVPWAIHIFATKEGRSIRCDFDLFAEWLPNKSKKVTVKDIALYNVAKWVQDICEKFSVEFTVQDAAQIEHDLKLLKQDMKG